MTHRIANVTIRKKVKLSFEDGEELNISKENYLNAGYLFAGKILTDEQYFQLIRYESEEHYRQYLRQLVQRGTYSIYQLMVRLITRKNLDPKDARRIVGDLEREGKVDDRIFTARKIETLKYRGIAPKKIQDYLLKEAKVRPEIVSEFESELEEVDPVLQEEEVARAWNRYRNKSLYKNKRSAIAHLCTKGYTPAEATALIEEYLVNNEDIQSHLQEQDDINMRRDADRVFRSVSATSKDQIKKRQSFIRRMASLGYNYSAIIQLIEEVGYEFN